MESEEGRTGELLAAEERSDHRADQEEDQEEGEVRQRLRWGGIPGEKNPAPGWLQLQRVSGSHEKSPND